MPLPDWARLDETATEPRDQGTLVSGIGYNLIAAVFQVMGSFVSILILSRMLGAEDFGIYGMIMPVFAVLIMLSDGGTMYYTLREDRLEEARLSFLHWYGVILNLVLMILFALAAPLLAWVMDEPRLIAVVFVIGFALLFTGACNQHMSMAMRCFRNDLRAIVIVGAITGSVAVAIVMAAFGAGYWALVAMLVLRSLFTALLIWGLTRWLPPLPRWNWALLRDIWRLGNAELVSRIAITALRESDRLLAGILFSTAVTGYYSLAYMLSMMPLAQLASPLLPVILPYLSEIKDKPDLLFEKFRLFLKGFIFVFVPYCTLGMLYAQELLGIFIGADMMPSARIFPPLVASALFSLTISFLAMSFQSVDRPDLTRRHNLEMIMPFVVVFGIAAIFGQPMAVALAAAAANLYCAWTRYTTMVAFFMRPLREEVLLMLPVTLLSVALPLGVFWLDGYWQMTEAIGPGIVHMIAVSLIFMLLHAILGLVLFRVNPAALRRRGEPEEEAHGSNPGERYAR